jgi:hypothetical protein
MSMLCLDPITPAAAASEQALAKRISEKLQQHYPDHFWAVTVDSRGGVATIRNLRLAGNWGFVIHLKNIQDDPNLRRVMQSGGELLERYRLHRGRSDMGAIAEIKSVAGIKVADFANSKSPMPKVLQHAN